MDNDKGPIEINIRAVVRQRLGAKARFIPGFILSGLERFICQERLNELLRKCYPARGADFCRALLENLQVEYTVVHPELLPPPDDSRVLFVSNHPLGGLDGVILTDLLSRLTDSEGRRYGARFVVNDLLDAVEPLRDVFVPVNKHGRQHRDAVRLLDSVFEGPESVVMFPAGLCSRRDADGNVRDLSWQKMCVARAIKSGRDIIPLHFIGENSPFFYKFAEIRKKIGMQFNLEMMRLPAELVAAQGKSFAVAVGRRIPFTSLKGGADALAEAQELRRIVYETE
ncbi:MAG: glycerol acyltransferase [Paramuribaculum sp.]|nr:glycerol acyltransferase [Paramuribaculum sp.]